MRYPTESELLQFFGVEPTLKDDIYTFVACGTDGLELSLSFNVADDSLQTAFRVAGREVAVTSHEGMTRMSIDNGVLFAEFVRDSYKTAASVTIHPSIHVQWSGLRTV